MIGQRLNLARVAAGLSLRQLSEKIENRVTAQAIGKYERNESMPGSEVLLALANVLDVPVDYLVGDQEMTLEGVDFRKKRALGKRERSRIEARVLHLLERYLVVEELLGLPSVEWDKPRAAPYSVTQKINEADAAARRLRQHWGLGNDAIPNLVELLEEKGIKVLAVDLADINGLAARACSGKKSLPVIVVNSQDCGERQRFTLAHELGHLVMKVGAKLDAEKAAHRFAGAFLMPAETLQAEIGKHRKSIGGSELMHFKQLFGVSIQALTWRCRDLGIFAQPLFKKLLDEYNQLGWNSTPYREPLAMPSEEPMRFERLTFRALSEGAVSESKAAELLGMKARELDQCMEIKQSYKVKAVGA